MKDYRFVDLGIFIVTLCLIASLICARCNARAEVEEPEDSGLVASECMAGAIFFDPEYSLSLADYNEYQRVVATLVNQESEMDVNVAVKLKRESGQEPESLETVGEISRTADLAETEGLMEVVDPEEVAEDDIPVFNDDDIQFLKKVVNAEAGKLTLEWVKEHLLDYYTAEEIRQTTLIVMAEDLVAYSNTVWSAHVWVILGRVGASGFSHNSTIIDVLSAPYQFSTYTEANLSKEVDPDVEWIVRDVFARKILEDNGAPEWEVGRTMPRTHLFFDNRDDNPLFNEFYRYCWGDIYDPFDSPYNPYEN